MNKLTLLLLSCCMLAYGMIAAQTVYMKHYTIKDGLSSNHVYMCHQDADGYIWMAGTSGLTKFDGRNFVNYDYESGLRDNEVLLVTNDAANNVWVKSFSAHPSVSIVQTGSPKDKNNLIVSDIPDIATNVLDEYYSATHKTAYLNGHKSLICIKEHEVRTYTTPFIPGFPFFETEDGKIFSGDGANIYTIGDTSIDLFQSLNSPQPYTRLSYHDSIMYSVSGSKLLLYRYNNNRFTFLHTVSFAESINLVHADKYGVWITFSDKKGAYLYRDKYMRDKWSEVNINGYINYFTNDTEGGLWISTTDNGVFNIPDADMINYTEKDGLASSVVYAADPLAANDCWLGYNTDIIQRVSFNRERIAIKKTLRLGGDKNSNNYVADIVHTKDNELFVLTRDNLFLYDKKKLKTILSKGANKSMLLINDTTLGIGAWQYELWYPFAQRADTYLIGRIYAQAKDNNNNLWLGGINGLYKLTQTRDSHVAKKIDMLSHTRVTALAAMDKYVWAGTQNNGIYLLRNDSLVGHYTYKNTNNLPSNTITTLAIKNNELWIGTNRGVVLAHYNYVTQQFTATQLIDHNDGILSPEVNDLKIFDSVIYVATYGGITIITNPVPARLNYKISDIIIRNPDKDKLLQGDSVQAYYSTKGLEIKFHTIAFKYNNELTYKYKLEPFDNEWRTTKDNVIQYTNIPPGKYNFLIRVNDNRGNSGAQKVFIEILPLFTQTIWFTLLVVLGCIILISCIIYWYYRYTKKVTNNRLAQGKIIAKAQLDALRSQIKPHFIFNSLNAIKDYIYNNKNDDAANLLQGFAGLIRKGLKLADSDYITIAEEAAFLKQYLELELKKCDGCFKYALEINGDIADWVIPSLITQPFVENAVIHGVRTAKAQHPLLTITYTQQAEDIICRITDNGVGIKHSLQRKKENPSKGVSISRDRISYFKSGLGVDIRLTIQDISETTGNKTGTVVTIVIKNAYKFSSNEKYIQNTDNR